MATMASGELSHLFEDFLKEATDRAGAPIYRERVSQMISGGAKSLVVDFVDILRYNDNIANKILLNPDSSLKSFKTAAYETMRSENALYADKVSRDLAVRIRGIPDLVPLRSVDIEYLDKMLAVSGMIVRTSELRPKIIEAVWACPNGHITTVEQHDEQLKKPDRCSDGACQAKGFELDRKQSRFIDFQIIRVQELPEELPPGQLPQFFDVNLEGDIVNTARPGDRVVLTGVLRAVPDYSGQIRMRLFRSEIDCNYVEVRGKEAEQIFITRQDEEVIKTVAGSPDAYERLISSVAPAILGREPEKEAILLLLVGGSSTILPDGTKLRGDINTLFVGDPGTGKSELLKFAAQLAPRGMFASGRGTTAAGLSAAVIREKNVFMLEAGVVVLADQGIAAIDEFDKMRAEDRSALHEQMESQRVTIAKGGIYASLNARTAILAAMNPVLGKYNPFQNLIDNIGDMPIPLLTRFDLIFVIKDQPSLGEDEKMATHILTVHSRKGFPRPPPVEFQLLKKYITYAKNGTPKLSKDAMDRLRDYYLELRKSGGEEGQLPPTPRTLESLIRLATARAKLLLRDEVGEEDALAAVALMNRMVQDVLTDATTKKTDFGIQLGKPAGERKNVGRAVEIFKTLETADKKPVERKAFKEELLKAKFTDEDAEKVIRTMFREGLIYESKPGFFRRVNA